MNKPIPLFLLLSVALSASCSSASGPQLLTSVDELAGSWVMLQNTAIQIADSTKRLDAMALYGIAYDTLVIAKGGTFLNSSKDRYLTSVETGTITLANGILTWTVVRGGTPLLPSLYFRLAGSGNDMIWSGIDTSYAHFSNDSPPDPSHQRIRWHRS